MAFSALAAGIPAPLAVARTNLIGFRAVSRGLSENHEVGEGGLQRSRNRPLGRPSGHGSRFLQPR